MITELRLRNLKALANATVPLDRFTVLVGGNGTGKSTVLQSFDVLSSATNASDSENDSGLLRLGPEWEPRRLRTSGTTEPIDLVADFSEPDVTLALTTSSGVTEFGGGSWRIAKELERSSLTRAQRADLRLAGSSARLQLDPRQLAREAVSQEEPRMASDGAGLADVLAWLAQSDPETKERIEAAVQKVVPRALRYRVNRTRMLHSEDVIVDGVSGGEATLRTVRRNVVAQRFELQFKAAGWIPSDQLSEGTLLAIGLMTALHTSGRPRLILLDDLDRGLHPRAQREVVEVLKKLLDEPNNADLQIIATTHSPFVVDCVDPSTVRVMSVDKNEHAVCKKLTDHPDWERWRTSLRAGEFWSFVGEDWMFGK